MTNKFGYDQLAIKPETYHDFEVIHEEIASREKNRKITVDEIVKRLIGIYRDVFPKQESI
jgi:hypothetical protein